MAQTIHTIQMVTNCHTYRPTSKLSTDSVLLSCLVHLTTLDYIVSIPKNKSVNLAIDWPIHWMPTLSFSCNLLLPSRL